MFTGLMKSDSGVKDSERSHKLPEGNQISALLLTTRWLFDFTNITSVTRSIVNTLRFYNPSDLKINITCAVLALDGNIEQIQLDDADKENVRLRGAIPPQGEDKTTPEIRWINQLSSSYYQSLLNDNSYNYIIGHAPLLAFGAANLRGTWKGPNSPKVVLMVHALPKTENGNIDKQLLCNWMKGTDVVFSIGETESKKLKRFVYGKLHHVYIPLYPLKSIATSGTPVFQKVTLIVGKKETGYNGIHVKLAIAATARAVEQISGTLKTQIVFVGDEPAVESDLKVIFDSTFKQLGMRKDLLEFCFLPSEWKTESRMTLKKCITESTLFLLPLKKNYSVFGLETLTAALAGIPILVSENCGVAALLRDAGEDAHSVVNQRKDFDSNVRGWAEQISEKISKRSEARDEATKLRESLLKSTHIGTTHLKFISTIIRKCFF